MTCVLFVPILLLTIILSGPYASPRLLILSTSSPPNATVRKSGEYYEDKEYAKSARGETSDMGRGGTSVFAAMAVAGDGGSLFTAEVRSTIPIAFGSRGVPTETPPT